jgi:hypothetical protein
LHLRGLIKITRILEVNYMKLFNFVAGVGAALLVGSAAPLARGQATEPSVPSGSTAIAPAATSPTVPGEKAAPGAPGSGMSHTPAMDKPAAGATQADAKNADYVHKKIADAQAKGKDVSAARMQENMGNAALKKGMNDEAAQHFETAMRSIGEMPNAPGENSGEASSPHKPMPGAVD